MVLRDGVRHLLQKDRLADARRRDDETALPEADWRKEIDHAHREFARRRLKDDAARGECRHEVFEVDDSRRLAGRLAVHRHDVAEREEPVLVARVADRAYDGVARTERVATNLLLGDEHVFGAGEEVRLRAAEEAVALLHNLQAAGGHHGAAAVEIAADRTEDDFVALHRAEVLGVRVRPHLRDDLAVVPGMDVLKVVLRQVGVARHGGNGGRKILRNLKGRASVALRQHLDMLAALEVRPVPVTLRGARKPFHTTPLPIAHRLFARRRNGGLCRRRHFWESLACRGRSGRGARCLSRSRHGFFRLYACCRLSGLRRGRACRGRSGRGARCLRWSRCGFLWLHTCCRLRALQRGRRRPRRTRSQLRLCGTATFLLGRRNLLRGFPCGGHGGFRCGLIILFFCTHSLFAPSTRQRAVGLRPSGVRVWSRSSRCNGIEPLFRTRAIEPRDVPPRAHANNRVTASSG